MDLKNLLELTQGNLTIHLQKLEEGGYVAVQKEFARRKPRTTVRIKPKGRRAFLDHLRVLQGIAEGKDVFED